MRFKYIVEKKDKNNALVLREYLENDWDRFSLLNETVYDKKTISAANQRGMKALIGALRTQNFYPPLKFTEKIADAVSGLLKSKKNPSLVIHLDDMEFVDKKQRRRRIAVPVEEESIEVDDLMESDDLMEECSDETCTIKPEGEQSNHNKVFPFDEVA